MYFRAYDAAEQEMDGAGTRKWEQETGIQMNQCEMVALKRDQKNVYGEWKENTLFEGEKT